MFTMLLSGLLACTLIGDLWVNVDTIVSGEIIDQHGTPLSGTARVCVAHNFMSSNQKLGFEIDTDGGWLCQDVIVTNGAFSYTKSDKVYVDVYLLEKDYKTDIDNVSVQYHSSNAWITDTDSVQQAETDVINVEKVSEDYFKIELETTITIDNTALETLR